MPTKAPADSAQVARKSAVIDDIKQRLQTAGASVLTEYRGLTVTDLANAARRRSGRRRPTTRSTRTPSPAGPRPKPASPRWRSCSRVPVAIAFVRPEGDAVTAAKALRDFAKINPNLVVKGGMIGPRS